MHVAYIMLNNFEVLDQRKSIHPTWCVHMCQVEKKQLFAKLSDMNILLIDDDEWIRDSLKVFFNSEGCRLATFETAEEALKRISATPYDIILVDYMLPGMNGLEFLKRISESHRITAKILVTAYGNSTLLSTAIKIGIQDYIEKPFSSGTIEESLTRLLNNIQTRQQCFLAGINREGEKYWRIAPRD